MNTLRKTELENTPFFNDPGSYKQSRHTLLNDQTLLADCGRDYTYDEAGNLTKISQTGTNPFTREMIVHRDNNRALLRSLDFEPSPDADWEALGYFDASGNQTKHDHLREMNWNYRDNVASVKIIPRDDAKPDDAEYYVYDASGQRVRKVKETLDHGVVKIDEKIYLGAVEIRRRREKVSDKINEERYTLHVMDDKQRIAVVHTWTAHDYRPDSEYAPELGVPYVRYQYSNHLGSASLELDGGKEARVISYEEYYPYGETSFIAGKNRTEVGFKEYRYTSKEKDDSTGLYYFGARYYAPWMGRWLSADPAGPVDGLNLYTYVSGNPIAKIDIKGNESVNASPSGNTQLSKLVNWFRSSKEQIVTPPFPLSIGIYKKENILMSVQERTKVLLDRTEHMIIPGLHTGGWTEKSDTGFKGALRDSKHHFSSSNQVGHFLTAVRHSMFGFKQSDIYGIFGGSIKEDPSLSPRHSAMKLDIGHELIADPDTRNPWDAVKVFQAQYDAATMADIETFEKALSNISNDPNATIDFERIDKDLKPILDKINVQLKGNSREDIRLTLLGWKFGEMVKSGLFENNEQAASWLERNLGTGMAELNNSDKKSAPKTNIDDNRTINYPL